jgi:LPS O-antigen subunit length determinant protein (WzzB/FepE family)
MNETNMHQGIEEDEIDLKELFSTIWQNKFTIAIFALLITSAALLYALKTPNTYRSSTVLILKENSKPSISGGAAAMAAMAGINLGGGGGGIDIASLFKNLLGNYAFNKEIIERYNLVDMLKTENIEKNFVFAMNKREIYDFFRSSSDEEKSKEELVFETYEKLKKNILSTSTDKESGAITLSAKFEDRFVAKKLLEIYLKEMSNYIKRLDLKEIDEQVKYYERELYNAKNLDLKANINELLSALVKKKVLSQAGEFYMVKQLTKPQVAYIKDKAGPKRALIIIVAFITSIILGIFFIFFKNFLKDNKERESDLSF